MKYKQENTRSDTRGTHPDFLNVGMHMRYAVRVRAYTCTHTQQTHAHKCSVCCLWRFGQWQVSTFTPTLSGTRWSLVHCYEHCYDRLADLLRKPFFAVAAGFLAGFWGFEPWSSCLYDKHYKRSVCLLSRFVRKRKEKKEMKEEGVLSSPLSLEMISLLYR